MSSSTTRRQFLRRAAGAAAIAAVAPLALAACGGNAAAPADKQARPTLEMWAFSQTRTKWQQTAFEKYYSRGDGQGTRIDFGGKFDVNFLVLPYGQMHDKLMITTQAGEGGPDVADVEISRYSQFIKGGQNAFLTLNDRIDQFGGTGQLYTGSATDPWSWQGAINGLGNELNACAMAYRYDLYEKYGIKTPINTYEEFASIGQKLQKDTNGQAYLLDIDITSWGYWWIMTLQRGGGFFDAKGLPEWQQEQGVGVMRYLQDALDKSTWAMVAPAGPSRNAAFINGEILTLLGPSWNIAGFPQQNLAQTKGKWMVQPMPTWQSAPSAPTATWGGTGVSIPKTAGHVDMAAEWVLWEHFTPAAVLIDYQVRQVWPTLKKAWSAPELTAPVAWFNDQKVGPIIQGVADKIPKWYNSPFWPEGTDAMTRLGLTPSLQGNKDPAVALKDAADAALKIINFESA